METETRSMDKLADLLDPPGFRDSSKPHVTDLIYAAENLGKETKPFDYDALPEYSRNIMSMGRIWESLVRADVIRLAVEEEFIPIMKRALECDGIIGNTDGVLYTNPAWELLRAEVVVEIKARFSPPKPDFPQGNRKYMQQCKAYCYMTGARKVWMPILYLQSGPPNAQYLIHKFEFTDLEVEETWQMILNMKEYLATGKDAPKQE